MSDWGSSISQAIRYLDGREFFGGSDLADLLAILINRILLHAATVPE
jgi:hypothetical protein